MFNFPENIVTRTAIGRECLTAFHSNCGEIPYENLGLNSFQLRRKENCTNPCYNFNLVQHIKQLLLPRICLFDRKLMIAIDIGNTGYWQWLLLAMDIEEIWMMYGDQILFSSSWSNIVPEFLIRYQILFQTRWCQTLSQDADARYLAYHYYTALLRKALLAIVYCTEQ